MNDNTNNIDNSSTEEQRNRFFKILIYNEKSFQETDKFISAWLSLPATQNEVQAALCEIGVDGKNYTKYAIKLYETGIKELKHSLPDEADIDELNYLASKIHFMDDCKLDIFEAVISKNNCILNVAELINIIDNTDCYDLQPAFDAEQYGSFLLDTALDEIDHFVDKEEYGRRYAELENGTFTDFGYLIQTSETTEFYKGKENMPEVYRIFAYPDKQSPAGLFKIENTDLTDFVYKLHIYGGNLISQAANNIPLLSDGDNGDFIIHLRHTEIRITDSDTVYQDNSDAGNLIKLTAGHTKAFMLHIDSVENNRAFGSAVMVDCAALAEDIERNTIHYTGVAADLKDGSTQHYTREQWEHLILRERDNVDSRTFNFNSDDVLSLSNHRQEFFDRRLQEAVEITPNALLDTLNADYMALANQPQSGMIRIPLETAKNMLIHSDAPVFKLTPNTPEQLSAFAVIKNGLMFPEYRDFAVKFDNRAGIDKLCKREINAIAAETPERDKPQKRDKLDQSL